MHKRHWMHPTFVAGLGMLLTLAAVFLQEGGYLNRLESSLYKERALHFQGHRPPPTPSLLHLDVDETALNYIGHWPWPRTRMARIIDEIALTKPKVVATDFLFTGEEKKEYGPNDSVGVDGDRELADAFSRLGCAIIPVSFALDQITPKSKPRDLLLPLLMEDPQRTESQCLDLLKPKGITEADLHDDPTDTFLEIREKAIYERIWAELSKPENSAADRSKIKQLIIPSSGPAGFKSILADLFDKQFDRVLSEKSMLRFMLPTRSGQLPVVSAGDELVPVLPIGQAAAYSGFVNYLPGAFEETVQSVPLVVQYRNNLLPHMALVAACVELGADIHMLRLSADHLTITCPCGSTISIPVHTQKSNGVGQAGMLMEVPLFGRADDYMTMYDVPAHQKVLQHISVYEVWRICEAVDKLKTDINSLDLRLLDMLKSADETAASTYLSSPPTPEKKRQLIEKAIKNYSNYINDFDDPNPDQQAKDLLQEKKSSLEELQLLVRQIPDLESQIHMLRNELFTKMHDRVIFFGGTATNLPDLHPTSIFNRCPGIVIHGAIYNAIITGAMLSKPPAQLGLGITAVMGLLTLLIVMGLPPLPASGASLALAVGYLAFNGYYIFQRRQMIVPAAGPVLAVALVWSGVTLSSYLSKLSTLSRFNRRLGPFFDRKMMNYLVNESEHDRIKAESREMTLCFADLANFLSLNDELGEKVVPLLAEYTGTMVPLIRQNHGTVAQLSGDGIFFFFCAPEPRPQHAQLAVKTVIEMHKQLDELNMILRARGDKPLGMRIGVNTGTVVIGDVGPKELAAYTALGAPVNLAARLETANKFFGTRTLMTARTFELLGDQFLIRPIANLRVVGKLDGTMVYEPLCLKTDAMDSDHSLVYHTTRMFQAYRDADFNACMMAAVEMERIFGPSPLTKLYTHYSIEHLNQTATAEHSQGLISLTDK